MRKPRVVTKNGDVFAVNIDDKTRKFFQLIAFDLTQLNSDVIRAFKEVYSSDELPRIEEIVAGEVQFYSHCVVAWGVKLWLNWVSGVGVQRADSELIKSF
jgi:hypothetical protein